MEAASRFSTSTVHLNLLLMNPILSERPHTQTTADMKPAKRLFVTAIIGSALLVGASFVAPLADAATPTAKPKVSVKPSLGGARPTIASGQAGNGAGAQNGGQNGPGDEGSAEDVARHAAMKAYQDCLTKTGVTLPDFGGFGRGGNNGVGTNNGPRPSMSPSTSASGSPVAPQRNFPNTPPSLSPAQQAALDSCASLRPAFGRNGGGFGRGGGADDHPVGVNPSAGTVIKKTPSSPALPSKSPAAAPLIKPGAALITCLNTAGVNVKSASDIAALDKQSPKVAAALKKCAAKK